MFTPIRAEHYDFAIPEKRWDRPAVKAFRGLLEDGEIQRELAARRFAAKSLVPTVLRGNE